MPQYGNHSLTIRVLASLMDSSGQDSDLRALLRYALKAPVHLTLADAPLHSEDEGSDPHGKSERFKKLVEGIRFSKSFILTYQLALVALLLLFTVVHWGSTLQEWRKRQRRTGAKTHREVSQNTVDEVLKAKSCVVIHNGSGHSSSSSSTIVGDDFSRTDKNGQEPNEQSSLLSKPQSPQNGPSRWVPINRIKAWLMYQPQPIPIFNKTLLSNGTTLAILAFIGLQVFYTFFKTPLSVSMIFVFADRTSLLFVANLPLLYLFAAKNQPIKMLTGYSYESLNIFHRRLGEVMCLLALLHSLGMIGVWYTILRPAGVPLIRFLLIKMVLLGLGAFVTYELIYFTSLASFRQRWYELFLALHVILQAAALILVFFHHHGSRPYVGVALGIFLIDRVVYRLCIESTTLRAVLEVKEDGKTVALRTSFPLVKHRNPISYISGASNVKHGWKATQHVFLTVPCLARKHIIQAHPFTIASKAPSTDSEAAYLDLLIRAQDGFSADLLRHAYSHKNLTVRFAGPYGSRSAVNLLQDSDHAVIVAGGSGIAVARPLVWSTLEGTNSFDLEICSEPLREKRILLIWIIREDSHVSWLGQGEITRLRANGVEVLIPPSTAEQGHPNVEAIVKGWLACTEKKHPGSSIGVVASGPDGLNRTVRNMCASLVQQNKNVNVEIEKFGW